MISIHLMGAVALKQPGMALNEVEAKRLATAIQQVQAQYPLVIDAKTQAWINLAAIGGMVYAPRVIAFAQAQKANKKAPQKVQGESPEKTEERIVSAAATNKEPLTPSQLFGGMGGG